MPIENPTVHRQIIDQVMTANINDTINSGNYWPMAVMSVWILILLTEKAFLRIISS